MAQPNLFQGTLPSDTAPAQQGQTSPGVDHQGLAEKWRGWLSKPENAALLMQTGISMLQPLQLGQDSLGSMASALGSGFQARDRVIQSQNDNQQLADQNARRDQALANDNLNSASDRTYKERMGLSALMRQPRALQDKRVRWDEFYKSLVNDYMRQGALATGPAPGTPEFLKLAQQSYTIMQSPPGGPQSPDMGSTGTVDQSLLDPANLDTSAYDPTQSDPTQSDPNTQPLQSGRLDPQISNAVQVLRSRGVSDQVISDELERKGVQDFGAYLGN
jgi:hypothetical protein